MNNDDPNSYVFPFRKNYEGYIVVTWLIAAACSALCPLLFSVPQYPYWLFSCVCVLVGVLSGRYGIEIYIRKSQLKGYPLEFIDQNADSTMKLFGITDKKVLENVKKYRK